MSYTNPDGTIQYKVKERTQRTTKMAVIDDAYSLLSDHKHPMEVVYADYANSMKALANEARKSIVATGNLKYSKEAKAKYADEVKSLELKLNGALLNAPKEREAQRRANVEIQAKKAADPKMANKDLKKISQQAISKARVDVGSVKRRDRNIEITDKEWEAIQAGAITESTLQKILNNTDIDRLRELATPKQTTKLATAKINRIKLLSSSGYTIAEIATIKETYSTKVETENTKADLTTEISKKVGELQTSVEKNFATKTENVALEQKLQTQITQNAGEISSTVTKVEKLESDTTEQQKNIDKALQDAQAAQTAADSANTAASNAKTIADTAQKAADTATANAASAQKAADLANEKVTAADKNLQSAKTDLKEAQENLKNVTSRVDATEQEIADAKEKVDTANANVTQALKDVAEANAAASKANEVASKAQGEATAANKAASDAQTKAADAQKVANQASADALKAQDDLAALTNRVTKAETNITQTNEAITAQATKITETSNKVDGVKEDLANNYYSKTETDAQIKVATDGIKLSVSETYITKTEGESITNAANNALNNSTQAKKDAESALNKAQDIVDKVNSGELDGEDAVMLCIESTNGTTFKNSDVATIFIVKIYVGSITIDNSTKLKEVFGKDAYLQWLIKRHGEEEFTNIPLDDSRLNDNGFLFTINAKDIKFKAVFNCELNI